MPAEIKMPQASDTMTEGTVVKWLKKEGEKIASGEAVAEIETDKAVMEMELPRACCSRPWPQTVNWFRSERYWG